MLRYVGWDEKNSEESGLQRYQVTTLRGLKQLNLTLINVTNLLKTFYFLFFFISFKSFEIASEK